MESLAQKDQTQVPASNELLNCELSVEDLNKMEEFDQQLVKEASWIYLVIGVSGDDPPPPK